MSDAVLEQIREIIQRDVNNRGLARDPRENLFTACRRDYARACQSISTTAQPRMAIVTGFYIPSADGAETDGPLGSVFLARTLTRLGANALFVTDDFCQPALALAVESLGLSDKCGFLRLSAATESVATEVPPVDAERDPENTVVIPQPAVTSKIRPGFPLDTATHLIAIERPGPSHTPFSLDAFSDRLQMTVGMVDQGTESEARREAFLGAVPAEHHDQLHTMGGQVITDRMVPAHEFFEREWGLARVTTIGIGDGGNEIGMGKIPWEVIAKNIPNGGLIACRVPTDYNIVCGVSNWGAYGLAAGVWYLRGMKFDEELFSPERERRLWERVLEEAVLVDGVTGQRTLTVDGLAWDDYIQPLREIADILKKNCPR